MKKETQYKDCRKTSPKEYALMAGVIILGIVFFLPVVVILYCIPSIRATFNHLAYEDAMRGWRCNAGNPAKFIKKWEVLA